MLQGNFSSNNFTQHNSLLLGLETVKVRGLQDLSRKYLNSLE